MQITTMFFIVAIIAIGCFGMIAAMGSVQNNDPVKQTDTFGSSVSGGTNDTGLLVTNVVSAETQGFSLGAVLVGVFIIICIIIGFFVIYRKKTPGFGKYRT